MPLPTDTLEKLWLDLSNSTRLATSAPTDRSLVGPFVCRGCFRKSGEVSPLESLAAPQGFEPRYADPESAVLPLNEGAVWKVEEPDTRLFLILWVPGKRGQQQARQPALPGFIGGRMLK